MAARQCGRLEFQSTLPGWGATVAESHLGYTGIISIHAPRMGSDNISRKMAGITYAFQSTLPGWGATAGQRVERRDQPDFNPRSPDGERRRLPMWRVCAPSISIHAPRMGSDDRDHGSTPWPSTFQSTLPGWGATKRGFRRKIDAEFQSTLPGWGATDDQRPVFRASHISIHAPRMGSDCPFT